MELITKAEFARRAQITPQAVSKLTGGAKPLAAAVISGKIDIDHEAARAYAKAQNKDLTAPSKQTAPNVGGAKPRPSIVDILTAGETEAEPSAVSDVGNFPNMTLQQILVTFGTDGRFKNWMAARKSISDIMTKELAIQQKAGKLVDRDLMVVGVFEPFDSAFRRLLTDASKAIATQAVAQVRAGATEEEVETLARDILSSHIRPAKQRALRALTKAAAVTGSNEAA